jgi:hypothetical protein
MPAEPSHHGPDPSQAPVGFPVRAAIFWVGQTKSGRGDASTSPGLAPKEDLRRETQTNPVRLPCHRVPSSTPEREEDNDGN